MLKALPVVRNKKWVLATAIVAGAVSIAACSHTPSAADIPPQASFTANILADNTKLFVYRQRGFGGPPREDEVGSLDRGERRPKTEDEQKMARRGVEAMLMQNHYCRDGYMVLEQYEQQRSFVVRGECRDAADASDREKYSSH